MRLIIPNHCKCGGGGGHYEAFMYSAPQCFDHITASTKTWMDNGPRRCIVV